MALADCLPAILEAAAGMTVEQVQAEIEASNIAPMVDPPALAAKIVQAASDPTFAATLMGGTDSPPDMGTDPPPPNPV